MKRRPPIEDKGGPPQRLRRYVPEEWGGDADAPVRWYAALEAWKQVHGDSVEIDPDSEMPDVPFDPESI